MGPKLRRVVAFTVQMVPVAQPRQKHAVRHTAQGPKAINYLENDHPVNVYKTALIFAARSSMGKAGIGLIDGPIFLSLAFFLPRPARLKDPGPTYHTAKPDLDNLAKSTKDALKGVVWRDDATVCGYVWPFGKWYHESSGCPRVEIAIYQIVEG